MINVKLIVLFFSIDFVASSSKYCEICPNHTLCKYTMAGPSSSCKEYDEDPLTKDDVNNIVNKINKGRNFVASGMSRLLPQAANMNKIVRNSVTQNLFTSTTLLRKSRTSEYLKIFKLLTLQYWSDELAAFAQRWVDQCDSSTRPDKEDECRDLEDSPVGQNVVTITGPSPGMHLTSLIDVWFMQKRDYTGSVSYYNQSRDWKTNHFTQLIWAETDKMGCGRARFYVDQKYSIIERLVCNFAPKGNVHGKPVYAIGYPATQCPKNKAPDSEFKSLCARWTPDPVIPFTTTIPPVSSLLRILNLSNTSVKLEIDPIRNNLKQTNLNANGTASQRNPKTRHVFFNNSHASLRNIPPMPLQNQWNTPANSYSPNSRGQRLQHYQPERGHSRVYHGHDLHDSNFASNYKNHPTENFRKYDYTTEQASTQSSTDLRKYNRYHQCSRRPESDCEASHQPNQCTRRHATTSCFQPIPTGTSCPIMSAKLGFSQQLCPCNIPKVTCPTMPPKCPCNFNCKCFNSQPNIQCLSGRRTQDNDNNPDFAIAQTTKSDETRKSAELHYYDLLPNMAIRSGDGEDEKLPSVEIVTAPSKDTWLQHDTTDPDIYKRLSHKIRHEQRQVKEVFENKNKFKQEHDYIYDSSDSRERKRRNPADEVTFKPFWQMDEYNRDKSTQLKSMRYTTLSNRKPKKTRLTATTVKVSQTTETITVKIKDPSVIKANPKSLVTEKYLSFDELMHLRKLSTQDTSTDARRRADAEEAAVRNAAASTLSEYTANTPFMRKKHCTRQLTCTWTAPTVIGADGSIIVPGMGADRGSRTPPGYVEGCTRTSTCTRDFMNRNKFSTIPDESASESAETTLEDEDYCEKRALNVRRRDSNSDSKPNLDSQDSTAVTTDETYTINTLHNYISAETGYIFSTIPTTSTNDNCLCYDETSRIKRYDDNDVYRDSFNKALRSKRSDENLSYGDLYYLVLQKIIKTWKRGQNSFHSSACLCSSAIVFQGSISVLLFIFLYNLINLFI